LAGTESRGGSHSDHRLGALSRRTHFRFKCRFAPVRPVAPPSQSLPLR
jgi:hypothetical protein